MDWTTRISAVILWFALVLSSLGDGNAEQRIVCYYTNWSVYRPGTAKFSPQNINPYLCTHLIYAFGGFTKDNTLKPFDKYQDIEKGGYAKFTGLKTYNKNLKTMLAIGGWNEGSSRFSPMVADQGRRKEFVKNSVKFLRQNHFDGLDLDWEYPAFRDGGKPRDRNNYADLVQELREEFERESSKTGRPRLLLSMAVPAGIEYIDKGYDIPRLNNDLDFINLLSYDYHSAFEPAVNHHSPLYPLEEDNEYNYDTELTIDYTIEHLLKSGASPEKIVLGIPTYGRSYTLFNDEATDIGSPADGPGEEGDATREKGYLAYYEICENIGKSDEWEVVQPNPSAMGPYAFKDKQWVGYDDEDIVRVKARYVNEKNLGGIMFWSIDNDDFRGKCHGRPYPLIEAAKEAMLAGEDRSRNSGQKTKLSDNRKKTRTQAGQRIQGNTIGRKLSNQNRRTTTQAAASRKRTTSSKYNSQSNGRQNGRINDNTEEDDDADGEEVNVVKAIEKPRPRTRSKTRSRNRTSGGGRRKQQQNSRHAEEEKDTDSVNEEPLSNKLTTPEPPTTPDPGSDFKCEDEGFFPHPRDCKKYFWCLDSGPSGLGVVAHQFTCPSGLVFNKAADSCDYPRNVVCPKAKTSQSTVTTTRAPITAATSRTTYLHKPTQRTTTDKPDSDEEYEYYDDEEEDEDSEEVEEKPSTTTTNKPLLYKTINRSRPTTATAATTIKTTEATTTAASTKTYKTTIDRVSSFEDEEDPRVIKELIDLIKKAGGIEQLEKQLNYQEKNSGGVSGTTEGNGQSTPATISRSLYERVLNRQATRNAAGFLGSLATTQSTTGDKSEKGVTRNSRIGFVNGPGGAQFEGLDNVPEVQTLRRTHKPQYVTIERQRPSTSESPTEDDEETDDDDNDDNTDVASSEDRAVSNPPHQRTSNRRITPSYVNIRRPRPSTTTSENDVELKDEDSNAKDPAKEEEPVTQRHRTVKPEEDSAGPKFRYTNTQRFRSTTSRNSEENQGPAKTETPSESTTTTTTTTTSTTTTTTTEKAVPVPEEITETPFTSSTTLQPSTTSESVSTSTLGEMTDFTEPTSESTPTTSIPEVTSDTGVKLVDDAVTEILYTTVAASSNSAGSSPEPFTRGPSTAAISHPRPFGFPRRGRPTTSTTSPTSSVVPVTEQSRPKVDLETLRLPTLKELVGYSPTESTPGFSTTLTQSPSTYLNTGLDINALRDESVNPQNYRNHSKINQGLLNKTTRADNNSIRKSRPTNNKEISDNDILGSEEIQQRSSSSSLVETTETIYSRPDNVSENTAPKESVRRVEVPVKILDDADGEEIAELVLLRLPANKLNSAILKPVFRIKLLDQDQSKVKISETESSNTYRKPSSENDIADNRRRSSSTRRRIKVNTAQAAPTFGNTTKEYQDRATVRNRPRNRQRIVKARRRTRVDTVPSTQTNEYISNGPKNERVLQDQGIRRSSINADGIRDKLVGDSTTNSASLSETSASIKATTIRGNLLTTLKPSNVTRGFYVTKSSGETSPSFNDFLTTDSSIDFTRFLTSTSNDVFEESTLKTYDTTASGHETVTPPSEIIYSTTEESLISESTIDSTLEPEITTRITNEIGQLNDLLKFMSEGLETTSTDYPSTIENQFTKSRSPSIATTTFQEETSIDGSAITTFRPPLTTISTTINPTTIIESTTAEYSKDTNTEPVPKYTVAKPTESTEDITEVLKTSENSRYNSTSLLETKTTTIPITTIFNKAILNSTDQTENSIKTTASLNEKPRTYKNVLKRGKTRFTASTRLDTNNRSTPFIRHPPKTTKSSVTNGLSSSSISDKDLTSTTSGTTTKAYQINLKQTSMIAEADFPSTNVVESTGSRSYTSKALKEVPDQPQKTTQSLEVVDYRINSINPNDITPASTISTEDYDNSYQLSRTTPEIDYLSTNFVKTVGNDWYTSEPPEETGTGITTTEIYDKRVKPLNPMNAIDIYTIQDEENETESSTTSETTLSYAEATRSWNYVRAIDTADGFEDHKIESINISNDITGDIKLETFIPTTETSLTTDRTEMTTQTDSDYVDTPINDQYLNSTEDIVQETTETMSSLKVEGMESYDQAETDKQFYSATTSTYSFYDKPEKVTTAVSTETINEKVDESITGQYFIKNNHSLNESKITTPLHEAKSTFAKDLSTYSTTPPTTTQIKRTRGRIRFTDFAAKTDAESGIRRRPIKQVVVRRRLAASSLNYNQTNDANAQSNLEKHKIENKENSKARTNVKEHLIDEKKKSSNPKRRRVVVYRGRPRAESVTTTTMQSSSISRDEIPKDSSGRRRRKWRKRVVLKREKTETDDEDDQSIAETGDYFRQAVINDSMEDFRILGSSIAVLEDHEHVNSAGREDEDTDGEVNLFKSSGAFLRRPGTMVVRPEGVNRSRTKTTGISVSTTLPAAFSKIASIDTTEDTRTDDQSVRAQEVAVTLADPPLVRPSGTNGRLPFRMTSTTRKISTTIAPRTEALTTLRTNTVVRRRQKPKGNSNNEEITKRLPSRPRRPAIIDYDYYVDDEIRLVVKPELKDKLFVTHKGGIRCLDQGNFAHPTSCKKFITCARMVNGQVIGTEYTCPDKLSFDPVGGICNWSAGLGCEESTH